MGVDASYVYGYGICIDDIEIDVEFLKEKYKHKLNEQISDKYSWCPTWGELIVDIEESIEDEDYDSLQICLEAYSNSDLFRFEYGENENYILFDHEHLVKAFPESQLKEWELLIIEHARKIGIKNVNEVGWIEYGFFN